MNNQSVRERLRGSVRQWPKTLLGVGVVSRLCVEVAIELANEHDTDIMLIPSRRQVDSDALGGGYVEGWSAGRFADFVRVRDGKGRVILCRDHGGPWQNSVEMGRRLSPQDAMVSARESYEEDIAAGFQVLHIDTSVAPDGAPDVKTALERLFALYVDCVEMARKHGRDVVFEVGAEEQNTVVNPITDVVELLGAIERFCHDADVPPPVFVVVQTGTKVMEARNVGSLGSPYRIQQEMPTEIYLPQVVEAVRRFDVMLKQHNTDYLDDQVLRWMPWYGVDAANVAPEFGVVESRALLHLLEANGLKKQRDRFLEMSYASRKWEKWMLPDTTATDRERAVISGHYVFSTPDFNALRQDASASLAARGVDMEAVLKDRIRAAVRRYMDCFRLTGVA